MLLLLIFFVLIYLFFAFWLLSGLKRAYQKQPCGTYENTSNLSIIIAAHDEAAMISQTLDNLIGQDYPKNKYEIILVADRCKDDTVPIVKEKMKVFNGLKLIEIDENPQYSSPKKYALKIGIDAANSENLILMDADCWTKSRYLQTINKYFHSGAQVVLNISKISGGNKLLHRFIKTERIMVWSIAAAAVGHKTPFLAFGTSWAYQKVVLESVGGFEEILHSMSGDDDLLIYRMGRKKAAVSVCFDPEGWGYTRLPDNLKAFITQRRRHHSAGKYYATSVKSAYAIYHLSNICLWIFPFFWLPALTGLLLKFAVDYAIMRYATVRFQEKSNILNFILFEFGYFFYQLFITPLSFVGKIHWR
jgi:cellulose synthase/poly-beta-1,6-N-acetylglucosamine synthase-like glycosyltransferase